MNTKRMGVGVAGGIVVGSVMMALSGDAFWLAIGIAIGAALGTVWSGDGLLGKDDGDGDEMPFNDRDD